jgi:SLT domain-containing protein
VPGTSTDPFDPVANIAAACNYAADRYGSIDNVNGPY